MVSRLRYSLLRRVADGCSDDCKKKKLKCVPTENNSCERCMAGGLACTFATTTIHVKDKDKPEEYVPFTR